MPKKIDKERKARAVRLLNDHQGEYSPLTAAAAAVARQLRFGKESVRRGVIQSQVDGGQREGATSVRARSAFSVRRCLPPATLWRSGACSTIPPSGGGIARRVWTS